MMRIKPYLAIALVCGIAPGLWADPTPVPLQSIILSSSPDQPLRDSKGADLDDTFKFALGVFPIGFEPTSGNTGVWFDNFVPFFESDFADQPLGVPVFAKEADLMSDGSSSALPGSSGFSGMNAWLWVYNGTSIQTSGTEWFLGRADTWVFPKIEDFDPDHDCCGTVFPVQWALSDAFSADPVWGRRENQVGTGFAEFADELAKLQTYAIPEPRTYVAILALLSAFILLPKMRRRRRQ